MTENLLVFRVENEVRALNVNTVFNGAMTVIGFLVFVRGRAQRDEEAQCFVIIELVEVAQISHIALNELMNVSHVELTFQGALRRVFEIEVNEDGSMLVGPTLFDQIERSTLVGEEIIMKMVQKDGIFLVFDEELSSHRSHARKGS